MKWSSFLFLALTAIVFSVHAQEDQSNQLIKQYSQLVKDFDAYDSSLKIQQMIDSVLKAAKEMLRQPDLSLADKIAASQVGSNLKSFQYVLNKIRPSGCLTSEIEEISQTSEAVISGALTASPVQTAYDLNSTASSLKDLSLKAQDISIFSPKRDKEKFVLAEEILEMAKINNIKAQWYLDYAFKQKLPNCSNAFCQLAITDLKEGAVQIDISAVTEQVNNALKEAQVLFEIEGAAARKMTMDRYTLQQVKDFDPYWASKSKALAALDIPGVNILMQSKLFYDQVGRYLIGDFIKKVCSKGEPATCYFPLSGKYADGFIKPDLIEKSVEELQEHLAKFNEDVLVKYSAKVKRLKSTPAIKANVGAQIQSLLAEFLVRMPREYGGALIDYPQFAGSSCADVKKVVHMAKRKELIENITGVSLAMVGVAASLPTFGMGGLVVGALVTAYEYHHYDKEIHERLELLVQKNRDALMGAAYGREQNYKEIISIRKEIIQDVDRSRMIRCLVTLGFFDPGLVVLRRLNALDREILRTAGHLKMAALLNGTEGFTLLVENLAKGVEYTHLAERVTNSTVYTPETISNYKKLESLIAQKKMSLSVVAFEE